MITFVIFSLKRAWQGFWRNAVMSLAATATMVLMLLLLAGFWIIQTGCWRASSSPSRRSRSSPTSSTTPRTRSTRCSDELEALPEVASVDLRQPDEALERFRARLQAQGRDDLTRYLDANPLTRASRSSCGPERRSATSWTRCAATRSSATSSNIRSSSTGS